MSKNNDNLSLLRDIYQDESGAVKHRFSLKGFFSDPANIDGLLAGSVLVIGLAAIVLGFFQLKSDYLRNFLYRYEAKKELAVSDDLLGLKTRDTDQDGISDYDEINVYDTSPYLPDSDSDGVDDKSELAGGTDPNCPRGQSCFSAWNAAAVPTTDDELSDDLFGGRMSAEQLRFLLSQSGVTDEDLANFTDDQLLAAYRETMAENAGIYTATSTLKITGTNLSELSNDEIRELLRRAGVAEGTLNSVSDQELRDLVRQVQTQNKAEADDSESLKQE